MPKKSVSIRCNICGKRFKASSKGVINCPDCVGRRDKGLERPYTSSTVFLVCKWYSEGMKIKNIANVLQRSEANVIKALEKGGVTIDGNQ